jgi:hypothetical protein
VVWRPAGGGAAVPLATPGNDPAEVFDIDDAGIVYGAVRDRPYTWDSATGTGRFVPLPPVVERALDGYLMRAGWLVNRAPGGAAGDHALRLNVGTGEVTDVRQLAAKPTAVAANGWLAGYDRRSRAIVVTPDGPVLLPELTTASSGLVARPKAISDDGRTVGGDSPTGDGQTTAAVVWRCG